MTTAMLAMEPTEVWQLVEAAGAGDVAARAEFLQQFGPLVRLWLQQRWRDTPFRGLVDDAVQDVFVECCRPDGALRRADPERCVHGIEVYLRGIVRNVAARLERTEARHFGHRRDLEVGQASTMPARLGVADQIDRAWAMAQIGAAFDLVAHTDSSGATGHSLRELLHLHFEEAMPVRAIAGAWHTKVEHVHELRRRACGTFRACLLRVRRGGETGSGGDSAAAEAAGREVLALLG